ncbi:hypothetical protein GCM10010391_44980 [Streptomyces anthocyanicus]|nr:hypothetical protein GCM10010391_44980 [Streptomyces anthocyanicus]
MTGPSSNAVAAISTTELNSEILQNRGTAAASGTRATGVHRFAHPFPARTAVYRIPARTAVYRPDGTGAPAG